ncbi:MAG: putative acetyltransferase [Ilumatobacteraceae bacterium]|nr:putative acetyltransferase [Ilumatobacteraceae bacterium]
MVPMDQRSATDSDNPVDNPLDNPTWHALNGRHARFAEGTGLARRYRPEVSVFGAIGADTPEAWSDLAALVGPGQGLMINRRGPVEPPAGWTVLGGGPGFQMVLDGEPRIGELPAMRDLGDDDVEAMLALIALTEPGPFRPRTIELGGYRAIVDEDDRLLAMAGQRLGLPEHTEISAVCTHPDARRRGYAAAVTAAVARGIIAEGRTPILHVARNNVNAKRVYEQLGFVERTMLTFTALRTPG